MVLFPFTTTEKFFKTGRYPITILKKAWLKLRSQGILSETDSRGVKRQAKVVDPKGKSVVGFIYHGTSGGEPYYQIRLPSAAVPFDFCSVLGVGKEINVEIETIEGLIVVYLNY